MALSFIPPMMPMLVDEPPEGEDWVHEIKYDGYRTQLIIEDGQARLYTRNGRDWTGRYAPVAEAATGLAVDSAIIDGEMIVTDEAGKPSFRDLRRSIEREPERLRLVAFDLLNVDGHDIRGMTLVERRQLLEDLIEPVHEPIRFSEHIDIEGKAFFAAVEELGLEGMISKRADSTYRSGPTRSWRKIKCYEERDYEVAGILREPGEAPLALMVTPGERRYVGSAVVALNNKMRERLWHRVAERRGRPVPGVRKPKAQWTEPGLIARVRHLKGEEMLRQGQMLEIREED